MAHRGMESGMDFEYHNRTGPLDGRSPFAQLSQNPQQSRFAPPLQTPSSKKRTYSAFDSPSKSLHNSPSKPLPPNPPMGHLFTTPRKPNNDNNIDDSSAGETPRSPEHNNDSDATPDNAALQRMREREAAVMAGAEREMKQHSPTKEKERERGGDRPLPAGRRESWFTRAIKKSFSPSPGRGELVKPVHARGDEQGRVKKRKVRRDRELQREVTRQRKRLSMSDYNSGEDDDHLSSSPRKTSGSHTNNNVPSESKESLLSQAFTFIAAHPTIPHILSWYAQLAFNVFLLFGCAYLIYSFWAAIQSDVDHKASEVAKEIMVEMAACAREYTKNQCEPATRMPALEKVCENWEKCMRRDPMKVGRARVSAHTFAEIFNGFVEPISWKAMIFTLLIVFVAFATTNLAFGFFRDKAASAAHAVPQYQSYFPPPPPTPQQQRSFSGEGGYYGTPWHQPPMPLEPQPSGGFGQIEGRGSPVRRLMY